MPSFIRTLLHSCSPVHVMISRRHLMAPFRLDQNSALPLHAQVQQFVRELAQQDEYQNGAFLPDEITLANRLGISRGTMRAGIAQLVHEGLLERKPGRGTRVIS